MNKFLFFGAFPVVVVITLLIGIFSFAYVAQFTVVWKDFGTVENLHDVPDWANVGAIFYQNMTISTLHHGNFNFYTGPGGKMCSTWFPGSCSAGTVGWNNGTFVFVKSLSGGGYEVGAVNR